MLKQVKAHRFSAFIIGVLLIISACSGERFSELMKASRDGNLEAVQRALDNGAEVDFQNKKGKTALMLAASNGHTATVKLLIDHGADINLQDYFGTTAIIVAATAGHTETAQFLAQKGADPTYKDSSGGSALSNAVFFGHDETIKALLGFSKNLAKADAEEIMLVACGLGHIDTVKQLLEFGVSADARGLKQRTALMAAAAFNKIEVAKTLLDHEANPALKDSDGVNAFDVANDKGNEEMIKLLSENYGKQKPK